MGKLLVQSVYMVPLFKHCKTEDVGFNWHVVEWLCALYIFGQSCMHPLVVARDLKRCLLIVFASRNGHVSRKMHCPEKGLEWRAEEGMVHIFD